MIGENKHTEQGDRRRLEDGQVKAKPTKEMKVRFTGIEGEIDFASFRFVWLQGPQIGCR